MKITKEIVALDGIYIEPNLYSLVFSLIHATCPANLILLDSIILIKLGEEYF
jgi:hypothetical protein